MTNQNAINNIQFSSINVQVFTDSGLYTPTPGMRYCYVQCYAGGGAGGGAETTGAGEISGGGGGGAGAFAYQTFSATTIGAGPVTVTVGGAGAGTLGGAGGNGGDSVFGTFITCHGGTGGYTLAATSSATGGAASGGGGGVIPTGGDYASPGQDGTSFGGVGTLSFFVASSGGPSPVGAAGVQQILTESPSAAQGYAAGGSGAFNGENQTQLGGGAGAPGLIVVTEYIA